MHSKKVASLPKMSHKETIHPSLMSLNETILRSIPLEMGREEFFYLEKVGFPPPLENQYFPHGY